MIFTSVSRVRFSPSGFYVFLYFGNILHVNNKCNFLLTIFFFEFTNLIRFIADVTEMYLFFKSAMAVKSYKRLQKPRVLDASTTRVFVFRT